MKTFWNCILFAGVLSAAACSTVPSTPAATRSSLPPIASEAAPEAVIAATPAEPTNRERVARATEMLSAGKEAEAKAELQVVLTKSPQDATAKLLLSQIETDPVTLLGEANRLYVVEAGDTMSELAGRFVGDPLMFYALSRYNGLPAPNTLSVGRTLKVPPFAQDATVAPLNTSSTGGKASAAGVTSGDKAKANAVRLQALQHLNTGDVPRAVALLREAVSLDATDPAMQRDLDRALRIQDALKPG